MITHNSEKKTITQSPFEKMSRSGRSIPSPSSGSGGGNSGSGSGNSGSGNGGGGSVFSNSDGPGLTFPRLSLRSLLLNGPFSRRPKARSVCTAAAPLQTGKASSSSSSESEGVSLDGAERGSSMRRCARLGRFPSLIGLSRGASDDSKATRRAKARKKSGDNVAKVNADGTRPLDRSASKIQCTSPQTSGLGDFHRQISGSGSTPSTPPPSLHPRHCSETGSLASSTPCTQRQTCARDSSPSTPPPVLPVRLLSQHSAPCSSNSNFSPHLGGSKTCVYGSADAEYCASSIAAAAAAAAEHGSMSSCSAVVLRECVLCLQDVPADQFPKLFTCSHSACITCLKQYLAMEISESRITITCPKCSELMHPTDIHQILNNSALSYKFEDFMLRRVLSTDPDTRWCPAPDCGYAVIASGCASCPKLQCERPGCGSHFCYHCKAEWHPNQTCDMARGQRTPHFPYNISSSHSDDDVKACPRCQVLIVKMDDGSCNHMTCSVCGAEFCWLCMKEVSDLHYLSPSGCTFWGKKPWSRKKKALWQLGTLVGAPLGIALLAGLAVPAIIIGIPIWAGRKVHAKYSSAGRHKRNAMVVCSVVWSSLLSPVIAGVAVSIGVPILLAYVYGVVPISLCRSGGCGVITSASGVRIAFDDEADNSNTPASSAALTAANIAMSGAAAVRSFARLNDGGGSSVSGVGSASCDGVSTESVAGVDGGGEEPDRESASNVAIAPPSLAGSIASSSCYGVRSHKLEVHVEMGGDYTSSRITGGGTSRCGVVQCRAPDTDSLAVSERSVNTPDVDTASTRALAGSVQRYKVQEEGEHCTVVSLSNVTNVAQAGDSASTVMLDASDCGAHSGVGVIANTDSVAAPSILSSISANTTTNLYIPEGGCGRNGLVRGSGDAGIDDDVSIHHHHHDHHRVHHNHHHHHDHHRVHHNHHHHHHEATNDDDATDYLSGDGGIDGTTDVSDRHDPLHGSDPRLDSVSAIITARKFSAHSKGVTFSIGSASSQSRDHISLNLEDHFSETGSGASVSCVSASAMSGVSASALSSISASAVSAASGSLGNFSSGAEREQQSYPLDVSSGSKMHYCASGERGEAAFMESWYETSNGKGSDGENNIAGAADLSSVSSCTVNQSCCDSDSPQNTFGQALDYREAYGAGHYSPNRTPANLNMPVSTVAAEQTTALECVDAAIVDGIAAISIGACAGNRYADAGVSRCGGNESESESTRPTLCQGVNCPRSFNEFNNPGRAPLERHRSVPETCGDSSSIPGIEHGASQNSSTQAPRYVCVQLSSSSSREASKRTQSLSLLHS